MFFELAPLQRYADNIDSVSVKALRGAGTRLRFTLMPNLAFQTNQVKLVLVDPVRNTVVQ
jgi:hypothetical protein